MWKDIVVQWIFSVGRKFVFQNYANFNGRAKRAEYWWYTLDNFLIMLALAMVMSLGYANGGTMAIILANILYWGAILAFFVPGLAIAWRRLHDIGKGGQWYWISLIPIIGSIWLLVLLCTPSEPQDNRFGPAVDE